MSETVSGSKIMQRPNLETFVRNTAASRVESNQSFSLSPGSVNEMTGEVCLQFLGSRLDCCW